MRHVLLIVLLCVCGCSGLQEADLPSTHRRLPESLQLPKLPKDSETIVNRSASFQSGYGTPGSDFTSAAYPSFLIEGLYSEVIGDYEYGISLQGDRQTSNWAIYRVPLDGGNFYPEIFHIGLAGGTGKLWVMISDYSKETWKLAVPDPIVPSGEYFEITPEYTIGDWSSLQSPAGNLYLLLYATDAPINVLAIGFSMETADPLSAPTGLNATWTDFGLVLSWDPYLDARASEFLITRYYRFPPPDPGEPPPPPGPVPQIFDRVTTNENAWLYADAPTGENYEYWINAYSEDYQLWSAQVTIEPGPKP